MTHIAFGYLTASKHDSQLLETQPKTCTGGDGYMIYTGQGSKADFCCALGANYNGVQNSYSLPTPEEEELAERLCKITGMEKVKLLKTGSDACSAAVRIARGYNKKPDGIGAGYHGWGNTFIADEYPGCGCIIEGYEKAPNLNRLIDQTINPSGEQYSYCIIEPFELDYSEKRIKQLKELRKLCKIQDVVFIADEIITFGRIPGYSACEYSGIKPDIIIGSKALGNGYPISFVAGTQEIMEGSDYFISGTFFGETRSIQEAIKTLDFMTPARIQALWDRGDRFQKKFNAISNAVQLYGLPTRAVWRGESALVFIQEMNRKGYFLHPKVWFLNHAHTAEVLNGFLKDARVVLDDIHAGRCQLRGREPMPIFKRGTEDE